MKKLLVALMASLVAMFGMVPMAFADDVDVDCTLGQEYACNLYAYNYFNFELSERMHVYAVLKSPYGNLNVSIKDSLEDTVSGTGMTQKTADAAGSQYVYCHSADLDAGKYFLYVKGEYHLHAATVLITAEPVVSLDRTSITSLSAPSPNGFTVSVEAVADALSYEYQYGKSVDFSNAVTVQRPTTHFTVAGLAGDDYYYVRVRPFTVYNDGLRVYGNWSRAQAVDVAAMPNTVEISTKSKTLKYATLKKKKQSFLVIADDVAGADLSYKLSSVSSRAKRYVSINSSTGAVTVKKGLAKGTYKMTVKVNAKAVGLYGASTASRQLELIVK